MNPIEKSKDLAIRQQEAILPSAELLEKINKTQDHYAKKSSNASTIIKNFAGYFDTIDWVGANSSILSRISQSVESAVEGLVSSLVHIIPAIQLMVLFKQTRVNTRLSQELDLIQAENPQIYKTEKDDNISDVRKEDYRKTRDKIQKLQIRVMEKADELKSKIGRVFLKSTYFTYSIVTYANVFDKKVVKSFFKLFIVSVKELINTISSIGAIDKQHELLYTLAAPSISLNSTEQTITPQASIFIQKLLVCPTVDAVKSVLEAAGVDIVPPNNIDQFRYLMQSSRYRSILAEKFDYTLQKGTFFSRVTQFEVGNQSSGVRTISSSTVFDALKAQQADYNNRLELLQKEIKEENPSLPDDLVLAKAKQKLDAIEIEASLLKTALKQTMVVKHQLERPFFYYSVIGSIQKFSLFSAKFVGSCLSTYGKTALYDAVDAISKDLFDSTCISGIVSFFSFVPMVSQISFKTVNVVIDLSQLTFARQYKPNEYSVNGYYNSFLLEKIKLQKFLHAAYVLSMKGGYYLRDAVAHFRNQETSNTPYELLDAQQAELNKALKIEKKAATKVLQNLKAKDLDRALSQSITGGIEIIAETLSKANVRYYPKETLEFLNRHIGLGLSALDDREALSKLDSASLSEQITQLFMSDTKDFLDTIHANEVSHYTAV
jgi:hypothetical protein